MTCLDIISDNTGKEIVAAIQSTDVAQARISEINQAAESKKNEVLASIPEDYRNTVDEVNQLKGDLDELIKLRNVTEIDGSYASITDGSIFVLDAYGCVKLSVIPNTVYSYKAGMNETIAGVCFYSNEPSKESFISGVIGLETIQKVIVPQNAKYAVFSYRKSVISDYNECVNFCGSVLDIQTELDNVQTELDNVQTELDNVQTDLGKFEYEIIDGYYAVYQSGVIYDLSTYCVTTFIDVGISDIYVQTNVANDIAGTCFYDKDKNYISGYNPYSENNILVKLDIPENARYVRISCRANYKDKLKVIRKNTINSIINKIEKINDELIESVSIPSFVLPSKSIAVVGHEWNMYFDNVIDCLTDGYDIICTCNKIITSLKQLNDCLRMKPISSDVGNIEITMKLVNSVTGENVSSAVLNVIIIDDKTVANKNVIFIGDSLTNAGFYPSEIQYNLSNSGITSIGTITNNDVWIGSSKYSVNHEGRSGWAAYDYTSKSEYLSVSNAFWDGSKFNFSWYMEQNGFTQVDAVCLGLGTNGMGAIEGNISALDLMIASIREYSSTVPIIISLITPPATQDGCGNCCNLQSSKVLKRSELALIKKYLEKYDDVSANVHVAELYFALDCKNDFPTDEQVLSERNPNKIIRQTNNVHPNVYGYLKFADVYYNNLIYYMDN